MNIMNKKLVAYFSIGGRTAKVAETLAQALNADLYEIKPKVKYREADLDWRDENSRVSIEINNKSIRPAIVTDDVDISAYGTVYLGFPIWWYVAPSLIRSFLEIYDFTGRKVVLFATSGGSRDFGNTVSELQPSAPNAEFSESKVLVGSFTDAEVRELISALSEAD